MITGVHTHLQGLQSFIFIEGNRPLNKSLEAVYSYLQEV